jgi:hypothetical protein
MFGKDYEVDYSKLPMTPEIELEMNLSKMKPRVFELDEDEHPATMDSLKWAEEKLNHTLVIPHIENPPMEEGSEEYNKIFDYEDDEDVTSTLKSAHQAEMIYGLHNHRVYGYGYGYGNYSNATNGNFSNGNYSYGYWNRPAGLNGEAEHPQYKSVMPSWGGNSTHNAYDKKYGDPEPEVPGYFRGYGYGTPGSVDGANTDWYNHLVKDLSNWGDGMHSSKVGIMDPTHGHFSDSRFSNMTKEAIEEVARQIIAR